MLTNVQRRQGGLSLVEVFVALLVLSVGLIAIAKLQVDLVRSGADSRARSAALVLAEEKMEDLRSFGVIDSTEPWSATVAELSWSHIATNEGGRLVPIATAGSQLQFSNVQFTRTWTSSASLTLPGTTTGAYKEVEVTVAWQDVNGVNQSAKVTGTIDAANPADVVLASQNFGSQPGPRVQYQPGHAPDVIAVPIDIGGNKNRETTKPLPDVSTGQGDYHEVRFDVINYSADGGQTYADKREEFATVNCRCELAGEGQGRTPARIEFDGVTVKDQPGRIVLKSETGTSASSQNPDLCVICCRDHHDGPDVTDRYSDPSANHTHILEAGNEYNEACRLKRINGVFQVFEDWKLATLTVARDQFLQADPGLGNYVNYVAEYVTAAVSESPAPAKPAGRDFGIDRGAGAQLFGRAIYVDRMPQELLDFVRRRISRGESYLEYVPFYEVNLTKLGNWSVATAAGGPQTNASPCPPRNDGTMILCVTNEAIVDEGLSENNYSRGLAVAGHAVGGGSNRAVETANSDNTGVSGSPAINLTTTSVSDYVTVTVNASATQGGVQGKISFCSITGNTKQDRENKLYAALSVSYTGGGGGTCSKSTAGNSMNYSCENIPTGSVVTITPSFSPTGSFHATPTSGDFTIGTSVDPAGPSFVICDN